MSLVCWECGKHEGERKFVDVHFPEDGDALRAYHSACLTAIINERWQLLLRPAVPAPVSANIERLRAENDKLRNALGVICGASDMGEPAAVWMRGIARRAMERP